MKKEIHPEYHQETSIKCACGAEYKVGGTVASISIEVCANCHPFYAGTDRILDTAGRVEKFKKRFNL